MTPPPAKGFQRHLPLLWLLPLVLLCSAIGSGRTVERGPYFGERAPVCSPTCVHAITGVPTIYAPGGAVRGASAIDNQFLYTGQRWFADLGLYYYRNRWYDPHLGRFLSRDPLGIWGDPMNLGNGTAYVGLNPWTFVDPLGLQTKCQKIADWSDQKLWNPIKERIAHPRMPVLIGVPLFAGMGVLEGLTDSLRFGTTAGEMAANPERTWGDVGLAALQETGRAMTVAGTSGAALGKVAQVARGAKMADEVAEAIPTAGTASLSAREAPRELLIGPADVHVYLGRKDGVDVYVGITNNLKQRQAAH